jgi:hypothetical protein
VLFAVQEDRDEIVNAMRGETKSLGLLDTADNCWATFINKVKANLHVAFTASPVGEAFRVRSQVSRSSVLQNAQSCTVLLANSCASSRTMENHLRSSKQYLAAVMTYMLAAVALHAPTYMLCLRSDMVPPQRFLATINSTVIDWFQPWPEVSLLSVARKFLDEVDLVSDSVRNAVVEFMPFSSAAVNNVSDCTARD